MRTYIVKTALHMALWDAGGEIEVNAIISFKVQPGCEASVEGPAEAPTVEVTKFQITGKGGTEFACPSWIPDFFAADDSFNSWLLSEADEREAYDRDEAADARRDERSLA